MITLRLSAVVGSVVVLLIYNAVVDAALIARHAASFVLDSLTSAAHAGITVIELLLKLLMEVGRWPRSPAQLIHGPSAPGRHRPEGRRLDWHNRTRLWLKNTRRHFVMALITTRGVGNEGSVAMAELSVLHPTALILIGLGLSLGYILWRW